jgi:rhamnulokinase
MTVLARYLAVDLGAQSGRVVAGEWDGEKIVLAELNRFTNGPVEIGDHIHTDIDRLWSGIRKGLKTAGAAPAGIGVDTWGVDYGLLDVHGDLLGPPYHYRDSRTNGIMEKLFEVVPRDEVFRQTGIQFMQLNTLFQLYSMVRSGDAQLKKADKLLFTPDLFNYRLTGAKTGEYTIATTSQMMDAGNRTWAGNMLSRLGIPTGILPDLVQPGTVLGPVRPEVAEESGWFRPVPVIAVGSHDTASAVAAVPELDEHSAYLSSGTWSLMGVETDAPVINDRSLALNFTNEGGVGGKIRLLKNIMGLWLVAECQRVWADEGRKYSWDELLASAGKAAPFKSLVDPDAPEFLSPRDMPAAIREFCRRTGQQTPSTVGEMARTCLESLALTYRRVLGNLEELTGRKLGTVRIVGGGSQNRMLNQFTADACGRRVMAGPVEATALGNIVMQMVATGKLPDVAAGRAVVGRSVERAVFDPAPGGGWDAAYDRFLALLNG